MIRWILVALLFFSACASEVGDPCEANIDCGTELSCDVSQTDGYCTQTPCEVNSCPEEAVCIEFQDKSTFCMRVCDNNDDCRDGYVCVEDFGDHPFCNQTAIQGG